MTYRHKIGKPSIFSDFKEPWETMLHLHNHTIPMEIRVVQFNQKMKMRKTFYVRYAAVDFVYI